MTPFKKKMLMLQLVLFTITAVLLVAGLAFKGRDGGYGAGPALAAPDISAALDPAVPRPATAEDTQTAELDCTFAQWAGHPVDEAAVKATGRAYRILSPHSMATMDYSAERLNVHIDDDGIVQYVACG